ncbi:hypothetical protein B296_00022102, partial [Ensete ventricosum]
VMRSLKDYAVKAIANAMDHLGSVSYKVDNLLNYEVDEVAVANFEVSCIEQVSFGQSFSHILVYELITLSSLFPTSETSNRTYDSCFAACDTSPLDAYNPLTGARLAATSRPNIPKSSKKVDQSNFILLCYIL